MRELTYLALYNGTLEPGGTVRGQPQQELIHVRARDINAGFSKALARTREPLGNGRRRELGRLEFWRAD